jgi:hypothetical protein
MAGRRTGFRHSACLPSDGSLERVDCLDKWRSAVLAQKLPLHRPAKGTELMIALGQHGLCLQALLNPCVRP